VEEKFWEAARGGRVEDVKDILKNNPALDVNWKNEKIFGRSALHSACYHSHDSIVYTLLAHHGINVNQMDKHGYTPFVVACNYGSTSCVRLLLQDSRVSPNERDDAGYTPLWWAACKVRPDVIKVWIASGREMDLGKPGDAKTDAIGVAKQSGKTEMATLLEKFKENPGVTRHAVRVELGLVSGVRKELGITGEWN